MTTMRFVEIELKGHEDGTESATMRESASGRVVVCGLPIRDEYGDVIGVATGEDDNGDWYDADMID